MFALDGGGGARLPFALSLEQFQLQYYTGSMAPMDFVSTLAVTDGDTQRRGTVSMNRVFTHRHYRFYQSAYDGDGRGTTLAVSHDPWGIGVTYVGYALLLAAMGAFFFQRGSAFRRLWHHPPCAEGHRCCSYCWGRMFPMPRTHCPAPCPASGSAGGRIVRIL